MMEASRTYRIIKFVPVQFLVDGQPAGWVQADAGERGVDVLVVGSGIHAGLEPLRHRCRCRASRYLADPKRMRSFCQDASAASVCQPAPAGAAPWRTPAAGVQQELACLKVQRMHFAEQHRQRASVASCDQPPRQALRRRQFGQ